MIRLAVYPVLALLAALIAPARAAETPVIAGLSYSPSNLNSRADLDRGVSEAAIRADLTRIKTLTPRVRTYDTNFGIDRVPAIARTLGMRVSFGLYIGKDPKANAEQLERGLKVAGRYADVIDRVIVGNETLEHGGLSVADLSGYLRRVKTEVPGLRVGTAENWHVWLAHRELANVVDFIGLHLLPYWDGVPADRAAEYVMGRYDEIKRAFPGKPIVILESGWPSAGETRQAAVPSPANQERYIKDFVARARGLDFFIVEAFDQPWKAASFESSVGPYWGVFDAKGRAKFSWRK